MRTGSNGRIAISWKQTELDGLEAAPLAFMAVGAAWSWRGQAVALAAACSQNLEQAGTAGGVVARTSGEVLGGREPSGQIVGTVTLSNGAQRFSADLIADAEGGDPVLVFEGTCPPRHQDFWISEITEIAVVQIPAMESRSTVIAFPAQ